MVRLHPHALALVAAIAPFSGCGGDDPPPPPPGAEWEVVQQDLRGGLLSVWGTSTSDIWTVGGDPDGTGPMVLHYDGTTWSTLQTGIVGDLWWVFGFREGPVYLGGGGGVILRYQDGIFTRMTTPGVGTVFGIWGASPDDVWAVGGTSGGSGGAFAWKLSGDQWVEAPGFPAELADRGAIWKVWGRSTDDVWLVGTLGLVVSWDGSSFHAQNTGVGESLFTVHANAERYVTVGGFGTGIILENEGGGWNNVVPRAPSPVIGVCLTETSGFAVGQDGTVYRRDTTGWVSEETNLDVFETFHAVWIDPSGGVWAAGGRVLAVPLTDGVLVHRLAGGRQ